MRIPRDMHDQEEAFALSDSIILMNNGVIEQEGDPETIYRRPTNAYVADFIGGANLVPRHRGFDSLVSA